MRRRLVWVVLGAAVAGAVDGFLSGSLMVLHDDDPWKSPTMGGVMCAIPGAVIGMAVGGILAGLLALLVGGWRRR